MLKALTLLCLLMSHARNSVYQTNIIVLKATLSLSVFHMSDFKHLPRSNIFFGPLRRTLALLVVGAAIIAVSCFAEFRSLKWLFDNGKLHALSCPRLGLNMKRTDFNDQGNYCEVKIFGWDPEARARLADQGFIQPEYSCIVPRFDMVGDNYDEYAFFRLKNPIVCKVQSRCSAVRACTVQSGDSDVQVACPRGPEEALSLANDPTAILWVSLSPSSAIMVRWVNYQNTIFTEFCDSTHTVPVAKMVAVRGLIIGLALIVVLWLITDIMLHVAYRNHKKSIVPKDLERVEAEFNGNLFAHIWSRFTPPPGVTRTVSVSTTPRAMTPSSRDGMVSRLVSASPAGRGAMTPRSTGNGAITPRSFKVAVCQDPQLAFSSGSWASKVHTFLDRKFRKRGIRKELVVRGLFYPLFAIMFGSLVAWAYLAVSPRNLHVRHSVADSLLDDYSSIWRASATWIILPFLLLDELTDVFVFIFVSAVTRFAKPTVIAKLHEQLKGDQETEEDSSSEISFSSNLSSIHSMKVVKDDLVPDSVIGVVCVDTFHLADEDKLIENIESMIAIVGIERLFVLHFSDSLKPLDDTVTLLQARVHPAIQYVYVPDRDKLAAIYWFSKYYVPLFQLHQPSPLPITHILVADQNVWIPSTLTIPHSLIEPEGDSSEKVGLICFAPSFKRTARFRDVDLKFDIMEAIFQSDRSSMGDSEAGGALLTLWDRESLEVAAFDHKPLTEANGGDFAGAGIEVVRQPGRKIKFLSNAFIKVNGAPADTNFSGLFDAARRKRLVFTDVNSLFSPSSIMNKNRVASKPANLVRLMRFFWDTIRLPVLISTALRDPLGLGVIVAFFLLIDWIRLSVLAIAVIPNAVRQERPTLLTQMLYPLVYFFYDLMILRPLAVVAAVFWAVNDTPNQSIHEREDYEKDIPPCLPYPDAPWFSAWTSPIDS
jgi:hypothetical protein